VLKVDKINKNFYVINVMQCVAAFCVLPDDSQEPKHAGAELM
jgi:hypothetical protein